MVGHDDPRAQLVQILLSLAGMQYFREPDSHPSVLQPSWAPGVRKCPIFRGKSMSGRGVDHVRHLGGQRSLEPPRNEQISVVRMKMG
jgi:hypothetical protein